MKKNEVSQKNKYHILTQVCGSKKKYRWSYLKNSNKDTDVENKHMDTRGRWAGMNRVVEADIHRLLCIKWVTNENILWGWKPLRMETWLHRHATCVCTQGPHTQKGPILSLMLHYDHPEILHKVWIKGLIFSSCTWPHKLGSLLWLEKFGQSVIWTVFCFKRITPIWMLRTPSRKSKGWSRKNS